MARASSSLIRVNSFIAAMRRLGIPLLRGEHPKPLALQGIPGFGFRFGGRGGFRYGRGAKNLNVPQMLAVIAQERVTPVTFQHYYGTPYEEAVVSMYARDWAVLMLALIETDPERYSIPKKGTEA